MISVPVLVALIAVATSVVLVIIGVIALLRRGRTGVVSPLNMDDGLLGQRVITHARRRVVVAVGFSVALFFAVACVGFTAPQLLGIPLGLAPGLAVSGGLLLFAATPSASVPPYERTSASLRPRDPWSFGPRWAFVLPLTIAATLIAFLVWTGINSSPDENGLHRTISVVDATSKSTSGPYPGWFYGVPLIAVTVVLAASTVLALGRVSKTPSIPKVDLAAVDRRWREASTRVITNLSTAALLGYFGGTAFTAGQATVNVAMTGGPGGYIFRQPEFAVGIVFLVAGALLAAAGLVFLILSARDAMTLRTSFRRAVQGEMQPGSA